MKVSRFFLPVILTLACAGCVRDTYYNPLLDRPQQFHRNQAEVEQAAQVSFDRLRRRFGVIIDGEDYHYVNAIVQRVVAHAPGPAINWRFYMIEEPGFGAFALADGRVFLSTRFIVNFDEEEIAAVVAHEIAHVALKHHREYTTYWWATAEERLRERRQSEYEADDFGALLMARAGYDPRVATRLIEKLEVFRNGREGRLKQKAISLLASTHPKNHQRIKRLNDKMALYLAEYSR